MKMLLNHHGSMMNYIDQETLKVHLNTIFILVYFMVHLMVSSQKEGNLGMLDHMSKKVNHI